MEIEKISLDKFLIRGEKKFGKNKKLWRFKCPNCGNVQTYQDFVDNKIKDPSDVLMVSCIGRWVKDKGCNWTLGGLLQVHKTEVQTLDGKYHPVFEFAE